MSRPKWFEFGRQKITLEMKLYEYLMKQAKARNTYGTHLLDSIVEEWKEAEEET